MRFTEEEQRYFECLASGKSFEQMARALGWTYREAIDFGDRFFGWEGRWTNGFLRLAVGRYYLRYGDVTGGSNDLAD